MAGEKNGKKIAAVIIALVLALAMGGYCLAVRVVIPGRNYAAAEELFRRGDYTGAEEIFVELGGYRDAAARVPECRDRRGMEYVDSRDDAGLKAHIASFGLSEGVQAHIRGAALDAIEAEDYERAFDLLPVLGDAGDPVREALYQQARTCLDGGDFETSDELFIFLGDYKDSAALIHVHEFVLVAETAPTCEETGTQEYACVCGAAETASTEALGHAYGEATCTVPATCGVCGKTTGEPLAHRYSKATCTKGQVCDVCGQAGDPALGHDLSYCVCTRCGTVKLSISQLQGTWIHEAGQTTIVISGNMGTVYSHTLDAVYTGEVQLKYYGFCIDGIYNGVTIYGEPYTVPIREIVYISKFTSTYFVDVFDDLGPYTWYKQ